MNFDWLVGFLEGSGYFGFKSTYVITAQSKNHEVMERIGSLFGGNVTYRKDGTAVWAIYGPDARSWMQRLYWFMSDQRREQIKKALNSGEGVVNYGDDQNRPVLSQAG